MIEKFLGNSEFGNYWEGKKRILYLMYQINTKTIFGEQVSVCQNSLSHQADFSILRKGYSPSSHSLEAFTWSLGEKHHSYLMSICSWVGKPEGQGR